MTTIRRIPTSKIDGNDSNSTNIDEIRPYGEIAVYGGDNNKLELLMFDGVRTHLKSKVLNKGTFYGGDADSGDGEGYDTIKLVPDEELRRNGSDQYVIIDPTAPNHIHIRAGGTIDNSNADLFLGGERNNVKVSDVYNNVQITTDFDGTSTRTWTFNNNGSLQLPGSSNGLIGESEPGVVVFSDLGFAVVTNANTEGSKSWIFDTNGILTFPNNALVDSADSNIEFRGMSNFNVEAGGVVNIVTDSQGAGHSWQFGDDGSLILPDNAKINVSIDNNISIETESLPTAPPTTIVISGADFVAVNLTYIKDPYDPNWFPADYNSLTDPHITYQDSQWKILSPGFDQALYVNTGTINVPLAQWNTNPPLGSVAPTGVYTYADTYTRTWQFGSNGNLTLPNNSTISDTPAVAQYSSSFSMGAYADDGVVGYFTARSDWHYTGNPLINTVTAGWFVSGPGLIGVKEIIAKTAAGEPGDWTITVDLTDGSTWPFDESSYTFYSPDYQIVPAGSTLTVNSNEWKFGANGDLTFPDGATHTGKSITLPVNQTFDFNLSRSSPPGFTNKVSISPGGLTTDGTRLQFNTTDSEYWTLNSSQKRLEYSESSAFIKFGTATKDGAGASNDIELFSYGEDNVAGAVYISAGSSPTNNRWKFGANGTITFPDATVQSTAYTGTGTGAITFTGNEIEGNTFGGTGTIITKTVDNTGDNYSTGAGSIGFLNFGADGTIQNVKAGWTVTFASGVTRTVSQDAWQPLGTYWNISFDSAYNWSAGDVMPVTFSSPDYAAGTDPQVTLTAGTESWLFDDNGTLTLPAGGDIKDSTGVNQTAQREEGSWTVTTGTNTYSFTVPMDGTYVMWVKGNIPNGIITWNATASVSNSNVPAIGTQYAWNYTGGGSPILLTAIPDQIRGTAGTISTDATYAGTTSNRFDFTIANTSGASQTIYYGYTKI